MKQLVLVFLSVISLSVYSADFATLKKKQAYARETLLLLMKDATKRGDEQQRLVKESADDVSKYISELKAPAGKEKAFEEYKSVWSEFKKTRESDLVPAILAGKQSEAEKIATGIQKERIDKLNRLLDVLIGEDL